MAAQLPKTLAAASQHDYAKNNLPKNSPTIQTLAKADTIGVDWRSLDAEHPFRKSMLTSIERLNLADEAHWQATLTKTYNVQAHRELLTDLVKAIDYYDVPYARLSDFGADRDGHIKRPIQSGKDWISSRRGALKLSDSSVQRMSQIMDYMNEKVDYPRIVAKYTPEALGREGFSAQAAKLIARAEESRPALFRNEGFRFKKTARAALGVAMTAAPLVATAAEYIYDPKSVKPDEFIKAFVFISETSDCDSPACGKWQDQCRQHDLSESECETYFFLTPLAEQSTDRLDGDLNRKLGNIAPRIDGLSCSNNQADKTIIARVKLYDIHLGAIEESIEYDAQGNAKQIKVRSLRDLSPRAHIVNFTPDGQPGVLQYFSTSENQFKSVSPDTWVHHTTHLFSTQSAATNLALDTAETAARLQRINGKAILQCCQSSACQTTMDRVVGEAHSNNPNYIRPIKAAR